MMKKMKRENEIKKVCREILAKHLDGRKFVEDKVPNWGELVISDIHNELTKKFPGYVFGISFYLVGRGDAYCSNSRGIIYLQTDTNTSEIYKTDDLFSEVRVFANKKYSPLKNFLNNITPDEINKINKI